MRVGVQRHAPAVLPTGKTRYTLYRRLGGSQGRSGRVRKISSPTGIRSPDREARSQSQYGLSYPDSLWRYSRFEYYLSDVISAVPSQLRMWADSGKRNTIFRQRQDTEVVFVDCWY
jgi:hypothetical protein